MQSLDKWACPILLILHGQLEQSKIYKLILCVLLSATDAVTKHTYTGFQTNNGEFHTVWSVDYNAWHLRRLTLYLARLGFDLHFGFCLLLISCVYLDKMKTKQFRSLCLNQYRFFFFF